MTSRPVTAVCNECGKITDVEFKERYHPNKIKETFFKCEHCFYHYTSFVTNAWVRKKQRALRAMPRHTDNTQMIDGRQLEINERMAQLKYNLVNFGRADL